MIAVAAFEQGCDRLQQRVMRVVHLCLNFNYILIIYVLKEFEIIKLRLFHFYGRCWQFEGIYMHELVVL
jgi:hypothetical protein